MLVQLFHNTLAQDWTGHGPHSTHALADDRSQLEVRKKTKWAVAMVQDAEYVDCWMAFDLWPSVSGHLAIVMCHSLEWTNTTRVLDRHRMVYVLTSQPKIWTYSKLSQTYCTNWIYCSCRPNKLLYCVMLSLESTRNLSCPKSQEPATCQKTETCDCPIGRENHAPGKTMVSMLCWYLGWIELLMVKHFRLCDRQSKYAFVITQQLW